MELIDVGKIINTHGVHGEVKVIHFTDYPERFEELKWVYAEKPGGQRTKHDIERVRYFKGTVILKLQGIDDMTAAEGYRNAILKIDRKDVRKLPEDTFLICDLIGMAVFTEDGTELGKISDVLQTGSNDVYVVKRPFKKDLLIPALKSVVLSVDLEKSSMIVRLPAGLLEDEE